MTVVLFDPLHRSRLFPFTRTRPVADLRKGILTIRESWEKITENYVRILTETPIADDPSGFCNFRSGESLLSFSDDFLYINAALMPDPGHWALLRSLANGSGYTYQDNLIAFRASFGLSLAELYKSPGVPFPSALRFLEYPWQLVQWNSLDFLLDFDLLTGGRTSCVVPPGNQVVNPSDVFIEPGASVSGAFFNASTGPIYIGRDAVVMEGSMLRGPVALCEGAVLKMGARVYGATTLGPYCVAGGEIKNSILFGYSNKAHDGYLGDSLIGEWCNLGAGTTNSNIRNNATPVRVWSVDGPVSAGVKAGLFMGDYSRAAISSAFYSGAVVGVCCNIFGAGVCSGYLPDFSWGLAGGRYDWERALRDIDNWKKLKGQALTEREIRILGAIFGAAAPLRDTII